jgi:hypothetical protein
MTHLSEEDLILLYYDEPGAPTRARVHLAECAECRVAAESLARALSLCNELNAPERSPEFGHDVWTRLVPVLDAHAAKRRFPLRLWLGVAAFAVLLIAVFLAGRFSRPAQAPVMAGLSDQARARILAIAVADHLDRVQMLLTEIEDGNGDLAEDKARAEDLVEEGRLMRQSLAAGGETATTGFLDEVQRFLIEAAHTPDNATAAPDGASDKPDRASDRAMRDLRERIESGSLPFKVRIVESNLRNEEQKL